MVEISNTESRFKPSNFRYFSMTSCCHVHLQICQLCTSILVLVKSERFPKDTVDFYHGMQPQKTTITIAFVKHSHVSAACLRFSK